MYKRQVYENAKILILDEPTSALNDRETDALMECIRKLREKGVSVILITHKIEEIMRIADRVVVLRDGHTVGECKAVSYTHLAGCLYLRCLCDRVGAPSVQGP